MTEGALFFANCNSCHLELAWQDPVERSQWVAKHKLDHPEHKPGCGLVSGPRYLTNN